MSDVPRFDCSNGSAQFCYGCYQMERYEHGDYVLYDSYAELEARIAQLEEELALYQQGYKGGCWTCETVGEKNIALEAENTELKAEVERWRERYRENQQTVKDGEDGQ